MLRAENISRPPDASLEIEINNLWNLAYPTSIVLDGRPVHALARQAGRHRGFEAYERPIRLGTARLGAVRTCSRFALISRPGASPFTYLTRRQVSRR